MPLEKLKSLIETGKFHEDSKQLEVVGCFQKLHDKIIDRFEKDERGLWHKFVGMVSGDDELITKGIYIWGGVGRGKTMLMDIFYYELPSFISKKRVHFHEFMLDVHKHLNTVDLNSDVVEVDSKIMKYADDLASKIDVLCFDEFYVTDIVDAMILSRLFNALFGKEIVIVATTNWNPDDLYKNGIQRDRFLPFIDIIKDKMEIVHLDHPTDYRMKDFEKGRVYFWPLGANARKKMEKLYASFTDGHNEINSSIIEVKGHSINVYSSHCGVGRFKFSDLCERPLGVEDYIKIAGNFHTVFLEEIPKMGYDRRNEIKRLMNLVDSLYNNHVKLIVSAASVPEKLYTGHDHRFEFERTISRLREMGNSDYLENCIVGY